MIYTYFLVFVEDVHGLGLRVRIYGCERMRRHRLLGEAGVYFATLNLELENHLWLQLTPRQHVQPNLQVSTLTIDFFTQTFYCVSWLFYKS